MEESDITRESVHPSVFSAALFSSPLELLEELLCANPGPGVDAQLHLRDLLVDLLHEVDHEVDELVPVHGLRVEVGDQERDVVALDLLAPQDHEVLGPGKG